MYIYVYKYILVEAQITTVKFCGNKIKSKNIRLENSSKLWLGKPFFSTLPHALQWKTKTKMKNSVWKIYVLLANGRKQLWSIYI